MNALISARQAVADVLKEAGLTAHPHFPDRLTPPCVLVQGDEPYVDAEGQPFGSFTIRHEVIAVERKAANASAADRLDELATATITALLEAGYGIERVSKPYGIDVGTAVYPSVSITANQSITL